MTVTEALQIALAVVGAASTIAAVIPQAAPALPMLAFLRRVLDVVAMNWGNAANAPKPGPPATLASTAGPRPDGIGPSLDKAP